MKRREDRRIKYKKKGRKKGKERGRTITKGE